MEVKEISNLSVDKQRNADLNKLSMMQGPFTTSEQVAIYMGREDVDEKEKGKRLYIRVLQKRHFMEVEQAQPPIQFLGVYTKPL